MAEQPTDAVGGAVALLAGVDEQGSPAGSSEDQGGRQSGGSATHDDALPAFVHVPYGTDAFGCGKLCCHHGNKTEADVDAQPRPPKSASGVASVSCGSPTG